MRTEKRRKGSEAWIAVLGLGLAIIAASAAQAETCAPPPPWSAGGVRAHPQAEIEACLKVQAWETRNLHVPVDSIVAGIASQCEVRVIFAAGPAGSASRSRTQELVDANDRATLDAAAADVSWARSCAGR